MDREKFNARILIRCQSWLPVAVKKAAHRTGRKPSEYVRQAIVSKLLNDGMDPNWRPGRPDPFLDPYEYEKWLADRDDPSMRRWVNRFRVERPMTGLVKTLTPEQQKAAVEHRGDDC